MYIISPLKFNQLPTLKSFSYFERSSLYLTAMIDGLLQEIYNMEKPIFMSLIIRDLFNQHKSLFIVSAFVIMQ